MTQKTDPRAGKPVTPDMLIDVPRLLAAYYATKPDPAVAAQRVAFGTSGHRGSALTASFNEDHILATTQAICLYRKAQGIDGPLFIGKDTHALSAPALRSALEVLAANGVTVLAGDGYTPTPAISHAILTHNRGRQDRFADGIVITPSHNPPQDGGFKYNPPSGGPADGAATGWIERAANGFLERKLDGVQRVSSPKPGRHDFIAAYVADLANVVDMDAVRGVRIGIDPLGGAAVQYWEPLIARYRLDATVVNTAVDPTFAFMTADWDGKIRMDCSSPYAMTRLVAMKDKFDVAFANDTDADRHGIVCPSAGLLEPNRYLAACIAYLFANRPGWGSGAAIGKTMVSSAIIDRLAARLRRPLVEVPVGFKWFVAGLGDGSLGFGGEESAGASFLRRDGTVWTTDKDGLILGLLAAEMTAREGRDPGEIYEALAQELGRSSYARIDASATPAQKAVLAKLGPEQVSTATLAGEPVLAKTSTAPGNGAPLGGIKVATAQGWFAARPSGTEDVYKIYAESFRGEAHLRDIQADAQRIVTRALQGA